MPNPKQTKLGPEKMSLKIVQLLQAGGFPAFLVGGYVRDLLLNRETGDIDIATAAKPHEVEKLLNKAKIRTHAVNKKFGTILALTKAGPIEITTFRQDIGYVKHRWPKQVNFLQDYIEDSNRRDFTINALYFNPLTNEFFDPQNGHKDMDGKLIRFVGDPKKQIDEDALRMLRAVRFATTLGFQIEKNSFAAIKTRAKYIQNISGERIKTELDKILSSANKYEGIKLLDRIGLLQFIMPEVVELKKHVHKSKFYHLEGNIFEHVLLTLKNIPDVPVLGYAALYHDTGKATTATPRKKPEGWVNSYPLHEFVSTDMFNTLAKRLKFSRQDKDLVAWMCKMHMKRRAFVKDMPESEKIALAMHPYFSQIIELWRADALSNLRLENGKAIPCEPHAWQKARKLLKKIALKKNLIAKLTDGKIIIRLAKISAGKKIGRYKSAIQEKIIAGKIKNLTDLKIFLKNM